MILNFILAHIVVYISHLVSKLHYLNYQYTDNYSHKC